MRTFQVTGMSCAACSARVEKAVSGVPGVDSCSVNLLTGVLGVEGDAADEAIVEAVEKAGYGCRPKHARTAESGTAGNPGDDMTSGLREGASPAEVGDAARSDGEVMEDPGRRDFLALRKILFISIGFVLVLMYISMGHSMWGWPLPPFLAGNHVAMGRNTS